MKVLKNSKLQAVHDFWEQNSCGEVYALGDTKSEKYQNEMYTRYELEPYIAEFAEFTSYRDHDVLEIGVGMGSDHYLIALNNPRSLTGIDLTARAVKHAQEKFDIFSLKSDLKVANAENLPFKDEEFNKIYSWGVIHHSTNTEQCIKEMYRVLKPGGSANIMIYHKYSLVGLMLWTRYGLLRFKPLSSLNEIYSQYLESPGTKAYSIKEAYSLFSDFSEVNIRNQVSFGDLLKGEAGQRHNTFLLKIIKKIYPSWFIKFIGRFLPIGLFMLIKLKK